MNRASLSLSCVFVCLLATSIATAQTTDFFINHVAKDNWTTTITVYNTGPEDVVFDLHRWDTSGTETVYPGLTATGYNQIVVSNDTFGYDGTALLRAPEDAPIVVKIAYRYGESHSFCEFFVPGSFQSTSWMLPNPFQSHFDWFGMALANFATTDATVTLTAYQNGTVVGTDSQPVSPHLKTVDVSSGFWSGINYADVDLVTIESDIPIPPPISITGNTEQDRHLFFPAQYEILMCMGVPRVKIVPHVADTKWTTKLTIYNNRITDSTFTFSSWDEDGLPDVVDLMRSIPAHGSETLVAGVDFGYRTTGEISTTGCLHAKLSFQYETSESLCDFFLHPGTGTNRWVVPNSIQEWFSWFGIAASNPSDQEVVIVLDAYKDGEYLGTSTHLLAPHTKTVGITSDFWTDLPTGTKGPAQYDDIDMVILRSNYPIANPLSITGNADQDRHVFFLAGPAAGDSDFTDPAFREFVLTNYDTNHDGEISQAEADVVTEMNTPGTNYARGNIRDLQGIQIFRNLTVLECAYEQLSWLPDLSPLNQIHALSAQGNYLVTIPDLSALTSLNALSLTDNLLATLPDLNTSTWLTNLYLDHNQLTALPDLSGLTNLSSLDVSNNQLTALPNLSDSTNLRNLAFGSNAFSAFPDISFAGELRLLDCSDNQLPALPDLSTHPYLVTLYCHGNQITSITGLPSLGQLKNLTCDENRITDLSDVTSVTTLEYLGCRNNLLTALPDLTPLTNLHYLICSGNELTTIPGLSTLGGLITLHCSDNPITDLSPIGTLINLQYLECHDCPVGTLPDVSALDALQMFSCDNCGLTDIPDVTGCDAIWYFICDGNEFGPDDCPTIQAIDAMGLSYFNYNPQFDDSYLTCP